LNSMLRLMGGMLRIVGRPSMSAEKFFCC